MGYITSSEREQRCKEKRWPGEAITGPGMLLRMLTDGSVDRLLRFIHSFMHAVGKQYTARNRGYRVPKFVSHPH